MSSRQWRKLAEQLGATHRVIAPDFLGSGERPAWPEAAPFEFGQDVEEVAALLDEPADVVGHSYGGLVALTVARKWPDKVRRLAVYDPVAFGVLHDAGDEAVGDLTPNHAPGGGDAWFEAFVDWWNGPGTWRAMPEPARAGFLRVGRKVFLEVSSLLADRTPRAAYAAITAPTLLLSGEKTPRAAKRVAEILETVIPRAERRVVEGAGHMGPITHAEVVNGWIAGWMG
jgi:pimeloyl-ACP methyl ester carboxylesterase